MKIKTYDKENDLCLIKAFDGDHYFLGCIDLPQKEWSIDKYNDWAYKTTSNLISLEDNYIPQIITNASIKICYTLSDTMRYWKIHYNSNSEPENVKPFVFKDLLMELLATNGDVDGVWNGYFSRMYQVF